jgi:hypothetical protein
MYIVGVTVCALVRGTATANALTAINRIITIAPKVALFRGNSILFVAKIIDIFSFLLNFIHIFHMHTHTSGFLRLKTLC